MYSVSEHGYRVSRGLNGKETKVRDGFDLYPMWNRAHGK